MRLAAKILSIISLVGMMGNAVPLTGLAATSYATVSSVSIRVGTDCEAGDYLPSRPVPLNGDDTPEGTFAIANSSKYSLDDADWATSSATDRVLAVGDEPKMVLTLTAQGYSGDRPYRFRGGYSSSNVTVKGGTFVSARIRGSGNELEVTVKLKGIGGDFPIPTIADWTNNGYGHAKWGYEDSEDRKMSSGYFDVYLYRGSSMVKKLEAYEGTSYNFYPYMTKAGTYSFKVRAVAGNEAQKKYGDKSEWTESDEVYLDKEHVSDGSGQGDSVGAGSTGQVGWIQQGNVWYFRYPDGTYQKNSWSRINNRWYLFDNDGKMLTGWQNRNGTYYFLEDSGAMLTGWIRSGDKWYFLNPNPTDQEGQMLTGWVQVNGQTYYMDGSGAMVEGWYKVDDNWYYFWPSAGNKATNTTISGFYVDGDGIWRK